MAVFPWNEVSSVLLDMDGTLLDLHFDTHFWLHHVPTHYGEKNKLSFDDAKSELLGRYERMMGTMEWYSVDYWAGELSLDIAALKEEVAHLIDIHPRVPEFLSRLRQAGKRTALVTNAHHKSLGLKMRRTGLESYFDAVICAHDLGLPKEDPGFWDKLQQVEPFDRERTLLVDDSLPVLRSARGYGIEYLRAIRKPDTRQPEKDTEEFEALESFEDIMPEGDVRGEG